MKIDERLYRATRSVACNKIASRFCSDWCISIYICPASLSVIEGNLAVIRLDSEDNLFPVTSLECENGATGMVVSDQHAAESDVVAPRTTMAWMGMKCRRRHDQPSRYHCAIATGRHPPRADD